MIKDDDPVKFERIPSPPKPRLEKYGVAAGTDDDSGWHDEMLGDSESFLRQQARN